MSRRPWYHHQRGYPQTGEYIEGKRARTALWKEYKQMYEEEQNTLVTRITAIS